MLHTKHWRVGNMGKYFYFDKLELSKLIGNDNWNGKSFDIVQKGSRNWTGTIMVWKKSDRPSESFGRRRLGSDYAQWAEGDKFKLKGCRE